MATCSITEHTTEDISGTFTIDNVKDLTTENTTAEDLAISPEVVVVTTVVVVFTSSGVVVIRRVVRRIKNLKINFLSFTFYLIFVSKSYDNGID